MHKSVVQKVGGEKNRKVYNDVCSVSVLYSTPNHIWGVRRIGLNIVRLMGISPMPNKVNLQELSQYVRYVEVHFRKGRVLFRGQRQDKPLIPKIGRIHLTLPFVEAERKMFLEFQRQSILSLDYEPSTDWDWIAIMQHHGMPTRLLYWTLNPLAALWFAVSKPAEKTESAVVWAFVPKEKDFVVPTKDASPFETSRTLVFQPRHVTRRIVAQCGCFTVHQFMASKGFIPLERNKTYKRFLTKFVIRSNLFADLRYQLDRFGINDASLFPDLDGLSRHVRWLYSLDSDEKAPKGSRYAWIDLKN